jgi:hypothetical protein
MKSPTLPTDGEIVMSLWTNHGLVTRKPQRPQERGREERDTVKAEPAAEVERGRSREQDRSGRR